MGFTCVSAGAAVASVFTAHRLRSTRPSDIWERPRPSSLHTRQTHLWQWAAAPLMGPVHEAARGVPRAAGLGVTHVVVRPSPCGSSLQGKDLVVPWDAQQAAGLVTCLLSHVTLVAFGAAVLVIAAANRLQGSHRNRNSLESLSENNIEPA